MSKTVDERILSMQFDNKQFERNVGTTLGTLEKLKQGLNLSGAAKGLDSVNAAARKVDFNPMSSAVESVRMKFSALEVMAVTALARITNSAITAGKNLVKSFTIDPIKTGLQEYETQINAVQTILSNTKSKGSTLDDVNRTLDELNTYADKTIYNFTEMTRNIGTFTAAGIGLEDSAKAIQGIANLAAMSGSNSQQASTAMYQLSQAMASGTVKLMDWNSVVNAGMGGQLFQDALKDTARAHGVAVDAMIKKNGSFRESLQEGWITTDILTETLSKMTQSGAAEYLSDLTGISKEEIAATQKLVDENKNGSASYEELAQKMADTGKVSKEQAMNILEMADEATNAATKVKTFTQLMDTLKEAVQSGWTQTWEYLIGDFEEAKELWTGLSDFFGGIIGKKADARNAVLFESMTSGYKKLITTVNEAGMSTDKFYEMLSHTIEGNGGDVDALIDKYGSLEEAIKQGAISSEILKSTLIKYVPADWDKLSTTVDELVNGVTELGGRAKLIESFKNAWKGLSNILAPIRGAWDKIFPPKSIEERVAKLNGLIDKVYEFSKTLTENLKFDTVDGLRRTFEGLFSVLDIGVMFAKALGKGIADLFKHFTGLGGGVLDTTASIGDWLKGLRDSIKESDIFGKTIDGIVSAIIGFSDGLTAVIGGVVGFAKEIFATGKTIGEFIGYAADFIGIGDGIATMTESISGWFGSLREGVDSTTIFGTAIGILVNLLKSASDGIKRFRAYLQENISAPGFEGFLNVMKNIWDFIKKIGSIVAELGASIGEALSSVFSGGNIDSAIGILNGGLFAAVLVGAKKFIKTLTETLETGGGFIEGLKEIKDAVLDTFGAFQDSLKADTLKKIATAIAILAGSLLVISLINSDKLSASLGAITVLFADLMGSMAIFGKLSGTVTGVQKSIGFMIGISVAVLILASALKKISSLSITELGKGLLGVAGLMGALALTVKYIANDSKKVAKGAGQMILMAVALKILASVCKDLSALSVGDLTKGVVAIGALLLEFVGFQFLLKKINPTKMLSSATALVIIGAAMEIFADVCGRFGQLEWGDLGKAGVAVAGVLVFASGLALIGKYANKMVSSSLALVIMGASMEIFADVTSKFGQIDWDAFGKTGAAIAGVLVFAAGMALIGSFSSGLLGASVSLAIMGAALEIFADVANKLGSLNWQALGVAGAAIGGILVFAAGMALIGTFAPGIMTASSALLVMAAALLVLTPVLTTLGSMSLAEVGKSLLVLAGAFAIIGVAGAVLAPIVPAMLSLAGAIALLGVACLAIGAGVALFAAGLAMLSTVTATGATAIVAALTIIIVGIADLIPTLVSKLGEVIVAFCQVIIEAAPAIGEAIKALILTLCDVIITCVPQISDCLFELLIGALNSLAEHMPDLIQAGVDVIMQFFSGIIAALSGIDTSVLLQGIAGVGLMSAMLLALSAIASLVPGAMLGVLGMAGVIAEIAILLAAIGALAQIPGLEWLIGEGGDFLQKIGTAIGQFVGGIAGGIAEGFTSSLPQIGTDLSTFMTNLAPFLDGIKSVDTSIQENISSLVSAILSITAANLLDSIASWLTGGASIADFGTQLVAFGTAMKQYGVEVAGIDTAAITASVTAAQGLVAVAQAVPSDGLFGTDGIDDFGKNVVEFGKSMKKYGEAVNGIDVAAITGSVAAATGLVAIAGAIPSDGTFGTDGIDNFGKDVVKFGKSMKKYGEAVSGVNTGSITASVSAAISLVTIFSSIPSGGLGDGIDKFGKDIVSLGKSMKKFSDSMADFNVGGLATSVASLTSLVSTMKTMSGMDFKGFNSFTSSLGKIGKSGVDSFIKAFQSAGPKVSSAAKKMMDSAVKAIMSYKSKLSSVMKSVATTAASSARGAYSSFASAGAYLVQGFANGIRANTYLATARARAMANAAEKAAREALDINSPSRVFRKIGQGVPEGFAQGIGMLGGAVSKAVSGMSNGAIEGTRSAIATIADAIYSDVDAQPTIRPVLDLDDIRSGASTISGMFNMRPSVGVMSNVSAISSMMSRNNQNGANADVISAIRDLGRKMGESAGNNYNINGISYSEGSDVSDAIKVLVRAARVGGRT